MLPREKLSSKGLSGLTDTELLAVILGEGIHGRGVMAVAKDVTKLLARSELKNCGGEALAGLNNRLAGIVGIGEAKATQISCALELGRRVFGLEDGVFIKGRDDVVALLGGLKRRKQEVIVVIYLDARNKVINKRIVAIGSSNMAVVQPRDIFEEAIQKGAVSIVIAHNHPSGCIRPSRSDMAFTKRIEEVGNLLGVKVLDHVIL